MPCSFEPRCRIVIGGFDFSPGFFRACFDGFPCPIAGGLQLLQLRLGLILFVLQGVDGFVVIDLRVGLGIRRLGLEQIGQFLTPAATAQFMSSMFETGLQKVRILDPGAGAGVLFAACVETLISRKNRPLSIEVVAYETDSMILPHLEETMKRCQSLCISNGIVFHGIVRPADFISAAVAETRESLFAVPGERYTHIILNPPYKKINSETAMSKILYSSDIEVANLYAVFVWLSMRLLEPGGQMVAITPRSFCNGPYFRKFRAALLRMMSLKWIHIFESRNKASREHHLPCHPGTSETEVCHNLLVRRP